VEEVLENLELGPVTVLFGAQHGKYPDGNSLLIRGANERVLVDPALGVIPRSDGLAPIDRVFYSHCHEDHFAGGYLFPDASWHVHADDAIGFASLDEMMSIYGYAGDIATAFRDTVVGRFNYVSHPVEHLADGDEFDFGNVSLTVHHTPGHTRGHCCFVLAWGDRGPDERLLYLGDIELTSFGPYYGDAWSDLESFERSLAYIREVEARWYATFHHIGVLDRPTFLERLDRFETKIALREAALLDYLQEPHSLDEIAAHRFVYRPGDAVPNADFVERRSMGMHIARLIAQDRVEEVETGRFAAVEL
jgi:glyoxylase-like metal-dependent hydrolase (beta-lactamase superfamily II)